MTDDAITSLLDAQRLSGLTSHRDGGPLIASVSFVNDERNGYSSRLVEVDSESTTTLTRGGSRIGAVSVAGDGAVFFTTARPGDNGKEADDPSLFWLPARGEARKLAEHIGGFDEIAACPDSLILEVPLHSAAQTEAQHRELSKKREDAKVSGALHEGFPLRYWNADIGPARQTLAVAQLPDDLMNAAPTAEASTRDAASTAEPKQVLHLRYPAMPKGRLIDWSASPDGSIAVVCVSYVDGHRVDASSIYAVDLRGSEAPRLLHEARPGQEIEVGQFSPDGTCVIVDLTQEWTADQALQSKLCLMDVATGDLTELWSESDAWFAPSWLDEHTIVASADDHGRGSVFAGSPTDPAPRRIVGGTDQRFSFGGLFATGGRIAAIASAVDTAPFPVLIDPTSGAIEKLANPAEPLRTPGTLNEVHAEADDGTDLRAWLHVPDGPGPHPLLVFVHGGPWGSWNAWTYRWNPGPFVDAGYAVLQPDPAISTGYGQEFIERGQFELGGAPFTDVMALVYAAGEREDVDGQRAALAGGSYGGYMANWVAGHTGSRFRCIVTHASLWNTVSMGRTTDNNGWADAMVNQHAEYSPHLYASQIEVPMLVIHGDKDYRVPLSQGRELWFDLLRDSATPLDEVGRTQHRFLYFPDEGHWILGRGNAEVWYRTVLGFVDQHVHGKKFAPDVRLG